MALNFLLKRSGTASKRPDPASMALGELDLNYDSATGGLYYKDSAGNVIKVGPTQVSATAPNVAPAGSSGNSAGECWFDTVNNVLKVWDGSSWVDAVSTSGFLPLTGGTMTGEITFSGTQSIPVSGIQSASTSEAGVVQLNDTTSSTSTTEALTANQGKELQDQINALSVAGNLIFAGTIDATTGDMVTVTSEGTTAGFVIGDPLPSAGSGNDNYFAIVTVPGTMTPPGGSSQECHQGDWWLSNGSSWEFLDVGFNATSATTSTPGVVQLATDAEVQAGLNTNHAVTSSGLQSKVSDSTSTTSSTAIASSTAVKSAYDAGIQGQTDAAAALAAANTAGADVGNLASLTTTDKTSAVAAINEVNASASAAQADATQALSDASSAQSTADQAVLDASAAQTDATQALSDAASAQGIANQALSDAAAAQTDATQALSDAAAAQSDATQALTNAASAQATADAAVPDASYTALGDILSGTGAGTYAALALGTAGQVLTVDAACPGGLKWAAGGGGGGSGTVTSVTAGSGLTGGTITESGTIALDTACVIQPSLLTSKGNIIVATASATPTALAVGTDGQVLTACSACASGVTWAAAGGGGGSAIPCSVITGKGAIVTGTATATPSALPVGTNGQVLRACSLCPTGLVWSSTAPVGTAWPDTLGGVYGYTGANDATNTSTILGWCAAEAVALAPACSQNVFVGFRAGHRLNCFSYANTVLGFRSLGGQEANGGVSSCFNCFRTYGNTTLGWCAMACINGGGGSFFTAVDNVAIGCRALGGGTYVGSWNTVVGTSAASIVTTGMCNAMLGWCAATGLTIGCNNIAIGALAGTIISGETSGLVNLTTQSNRIVLGNAGNNCAQIQIAWTVVSDVRDKAIDPAGVPYGLSFINQIEPIKYCFCNRETGEITDIKARYGFSAQNICALENAPDGPIIVSDDDPDHLFLTDQHLLPVLVNAIKELSAKNDELEARLRALEIPG